MSSLIRTMCRNDLSKLTLVTGLPSYCQKISKQHGKKRHVSRNTVTRSRLANHKSYNFITFKDKKSIW